eukprot:4263058-Amphidinium_carterae.1
MVSPPARAFGFYHAQAQVLSQIQNRMITHFHSRSGGNTEGGEAIGDYHSSVLMVTLLHRPSKELKHACFS